MSRCRRARNSRGSRSEGDRDAGEGGGSKSVLRLRSAPVGVLRRDCPLLFDALLNHGARYGEHSLHAVTEARERFLSLDHLKLFCHQRMIIRAARAV